MKRLHLLLATLALLCTTTQAWGQTVIASGECGYSGDDLTWTLTDDGTLTISGVGRMNSYSSSSSIPWYEEKDRIRTVIINDGVTSIGSYAFYYCSGLTSIDLPKSLTSIEERAFEDCIRLTSIDLPESLASIGNSAFSGSGLTSVDLPESLTSIEERAFEECIRLTSIDLPESLASIGSYAFYHCSALTSIHLPENLTDIEGYTFCQCSKLASIDLPESLKSIGNSAFYYCTGLTSIDLPESLTSIGSSAFDSCDALTSIHLPESLTDIGSFAFNSCDALSSIHLPENLTDIEGYTFWHCTKLTSIDLPESLKSIGESAFEGCTGLTSIDLPESLTSIGESAFRGCTGLTSIHLTEGRLTSIGSQAFRGCTGLITIDLPEGLKSIGSYAFYYCTGLKSINLPKSLTSIGSYAFSSCTGLTSIDLPESLTSIGSSAFRGCTELTSIDLPESLTSIGDEVFYGCTELISIYLPGSLTSIGSLAFYSCTGLTSVTIPESVTSVGNGAFNNCPDLNTLYYNAIQCAISTDVWPFLSTVHVGPQVKSISGGAFYECPIKEVHITDIAAWCGIEFGSSDDNPLYQDSARLYLNGEEVRHLVIPDGVTYIADYAFHNIDFEYVYIPSHTPPTYNSTSFSFTSSEKGTLIVPVGSKEDYTTAGWGDIFEIYEGDMLTLHVSTPGTLLNEVVEADSRPSHVLWLTVSGTLNDADYGTMRDMDQLFFLDLSGTDSEALPQGTFSGKPLMEVALPSSMTTLGESAFENCERLYTINLERITDIGSKAFSGCSALDSVSLPNIRNIQRRAFANSGLRSVLLGRNAQSVAYNAFDGCNMESIVCKSETPPSVSGTFSGIDTDNCLLYVPQSALVDYLRATAWKEFFHMEGVDFGPAYTLTVQSADETQGTTEGGGIYDEGTETTITATALPGYRFVQWSDGNTDNPRTITLTADLVLIAEFAPQQTTATPQATADGITVYTTPGRLHVQGLPADRDYRVHDLSGKLLYQGHEETIALPQGFYIVRADDDTVKVAVR